MLIFEPKGYNNHRTRLINELFKRNFIAKEGELETKIFSDKEIYHRFVSDVRNEDVVIVGSAENNDDFLTLFDLGCAAVKNGAKTLSFIVPYFGYSTMERAVKEREVVKAKTRTRLFSMIPRAQQGNFIYLLDLHVESMVHYFEGDINAIHLSAIPILMEEVQKELNKENIKDYIVASADTGRAKQVQKIGQFLNCDCAFIVKKRMGEKVVAQAVGVDCQDKVVIIYDDMIRSGSSMIEAMNVYKNHGAKDVWLTTTHGVFCNPNSSIGLTNMFWTNSHDNHIKIRGSSIKIKKVLDTMPIFAEALIERIK